MVKKLTREGLRRLIVSEARRAMREGPRGHSITDDADDDEVDGIVQSLVDAFERNAQGMRGRLGYTYDASDMLDRNAASRDKKLKDEWDEVVSRAVQDLVDGVTPIVDEVWHKLEAGRYDE